MQSRTTADINIMLKKFPVLIRAFDALISHIPKNSASNCRKILNRVFLKGRRKERYV
jgi:hypothetical protein